MLINGDIIGNNCHLLQFIISFKKTITNGDKWRLKSFLYLSLLVIALDKPITNGDKKKHLSPFVIRFH